MGLRERLLKTHDKLMGKVNHKIPKETKLDIDEMRFIDNVDDKKIYCFRCNKAVDDKSIKKNVACDDCAGEFLANLQ